MRTISCVWQGAATVFSVASIVLTGCQPTWILSATFDADPVGAAPLSAPAGRPPDDALAHTGKVVVVSSTVVGSNAAQLDRGSSTATSIELTTGGAGPHSAGTFVLNWRGYAVADNATLNISLLSTSGKPAFRVNFRNGQYTFATGSGAQLAGGVTPLNTARRFAVSLDMSAKTIVVSVDGAPLPAWPFLDATFEDIKRVRFEYPAAIVEAFPGIYVLDYATIKKP